MTQWLVKKYNRCKEMVKNWADKYPQDSDKLAQAPGAFSIYPGWVETDMGGTNTRLKVHESVEKMVAVIQKVNRDKKFNAVYSYSGSIMTPSASNSTVNEAVAKSSYVASDELRKVATAAESKIKAEESCRDEMLISSPKPSSLSIFRKKDSANGHSSGQISYYPS